eukprot:COSAG06_NODE_4468_length_4222_cov_7.124667_4_plen_199_part_00
MRFYMHVSGWWTISRSNALHLAPIRGRGFAAPSQRHRRRPIVSNDDWAAGTVNCTEHKDPGLLSLIPCSAVPGLQVRAHGTEIADTQPRWVAVEALPGALPHQDVVVFPGVEMEAFTDGGPRATLHGVAKAAVPRISIVYERRAQVSPASRSLQKSVSSQPETTTPGDQTVELAEKLGMQTATVCLGESCIGSSCESH